MKIINKKEEWNYYLNNYFKEKKDVYNEFEYYSIYTNNFNVDLEAIFWEDDNIQIFWPHLIRNLGKIDQFSSSYYDLTTPYGYGGPLYNVLDRSQIQKSLKKFSNLYFSYALSKQYVCEFIRFHPLLDNWNNLQKIININYLNDIVVVDLSQSLNEIKNNMNKGHKYNINKTLHSNCKIEILEKPDNENVDKFLELYSSTMKRNNASKKYFFTKKFIKNHFDFLNSILIQIKKDNDIIASTIFLYGDKYSHYHLSGRAENYKGLYPNDLIIWEAIKWSKNKGFDYLNLGGGIKQNDDLFKFKKGFSKIVKNNYIGNKLYRLEKYKELSKTFGTDDKENNFFPAYRRNIDSIV
jgi:hypothetical protein